MATDYQKPISLRLDADTRSFFENLANKDKRKLAEYIRILLETLKEEGNVSVSVAG